MVTACFFLLFKITRKKFKGQPDFAMNGQHTSVNEVSVLIPSHLNATQYIMGIVFIRKSVSAAGDPERERERGHFPGVQTTLSKSDFKISKVFIK